MIPTLQGSISPIQFVSGLGPAAWFRYGVGITSALGVVSQWDDVSGNGRHLKQATGTNQPALQADNSILFDGVDNFLKCDAFTLAQPETVYILGKQITWTGNDRWWEAEAAGGGMIFQRTATPQVGANAGATIGNISLTLETYGVISTVLNGASSLIQLNNGTPATGDAGAGDMSGFTLASTGAGSNFGNIQAKEVIVYPAAHAAATRARVISYLMAVGGL